MRVAGNSLPNLFRFFSDVSSKHVAYEQLPASEAYNSGSSTSSNSSSPSSPKMSAYASKKKAYRFSPLIPQPLRFFRAPLKLLSCAVAFLVCLALLTDVGDHVGDLIGPPLPRNPGSVFNGPPYMWYEFPPIHGFYKGIKTLVPASRWRPEWRQRDMWNHTEFLERKRSSRNDPRKALKLEPRVHDPYPAYESLEYLAAYEHVEPCYLDTEETKAPPNVFSYPGLPQGMSLPYFGSNSEIGMDHDFCFERFGRLGPYGLGYGPDEGGLGIGMNTESQGSDRIWQMQSKLDWQDLDLATAQRKCFEKNKHRFTQRGQGNGSDLEHSISGHTSGAKKKVSRQAFVLRAWSSFEWTPHEVLALRSMISELSLKSGGEYDIHLLLHIVDETLPIYASEKLYQQTVQKLVPREFWNMTTLWSIPLMRAYYSRPFTDNVENDSEADIYSVYRSQHFALQWFSQQHPEYDYIWNWELDVRYTGHHYEFHTKAADWARKQPRRGLWERNSKFWMPSIHGSWEDYTRTVDSEILASDIPPVWGPVKFDTNGALDRAPGTTPPHSFYSDKFEWGVGEEADLITFDPIFDPSRGHWIFHKDITGWSLNLPIPPRRCAVVAIGRLSRRLLDLMHQETATFGRTTFTEMWSPTVALHHGLKAVYVPHAVFLDRKWPLRYADEIFNHPRTPDESPYGGAEHIFTGSSFYFNSGFSSALWRRWLGMKELGDGGRTQEIRGSGRMCLPPTLHHPVKYENLPED